MGGIEVEWHIGHSPLIAQRGQLVAHEHSLARARRTDEHDGALAVDEHVHEEANATRLCRVHQGGLGGRRIGIN